MTTYHNWLYRSVATTVSQLKICDFSGETFKGFEVLCFSVSATTTQLLSSGQFFILRYDTIPVKKCICKRFFLYQYLGICQSLSCDTLVANERHALLGEHIACVFTAHGSNVFSDIYRTTHIIPRGPQYKYTLLWKLKDHMSA